MTFLIATVTVVMIIILKHLVSVNELNLLLISILDKDGVSSADKNGAGPSKRETSVQDTRLGTCTVEYCE